MFLTVGGKATAGHLPRIVQPGYRGAGTPRWVEESDGARGVPQEAVDVRPTSHLARIVERGDIDRVDAGDVEGGEGARGGTQEQGFGPGGERTRDHHDGQGKQGTQDATRPEPSGAWGSDGD